MFAKFLWSRQKFWNRNCHLAKFEMCKMDHHEEIRKAIIEKLGRGCTIYSGKRGHALKETEIVYTLITRLELAKLHTEIDKIDKDAFVVMHSIKDARGGMIKKRPLK